MTLYAQKVCTYYVAVSIGYAILAIVTLLFLPMVLYQLIANPAHFLWHLSKDIEEFKKTVWEDITEVLDEAESKGRGEKS